MGVTTISVDVPKSEADTFRDDLNYLAALRRTTIGKLVYDAITSVYADDIERARKAASFFEASETRKPQSKRQSITPESSHE